MGCRLAGGGGVLHGRVALVVTVVISYLRFTGG